MSPKSALALVACALPLVAGSESEHHWSYSGADSPSHWGGECATGSLQSPVDIRSAATKIEKLPPLVFNYRPGPLHVVDNGHSVQVNVAKGSILSAGGVRFPLVQFHFHKPSEEAIDGHRYIMDVHLVHRDSEGNLAVVAVLLQTGAANPALEPLWQHLPREKGKEVSPADVTIDPSRLLPSNRSYFTYVGSLTTPPCTEHVRWFVLKTPVRLSSREVAAFAKLYPANARPIQPLNRREILSSK